MAISKNILNDQLNAIDNNNTFKEKLNEVKTEAQELAYANKATLIGKEAGEVVGGFQSLESKIDFAGTIPNGDAMCAITEDIPGLSKLFDPEGNTLDFSNFELSDAFTGLGSGSLDSSGAVENLFSSVEPKGGDLATAVSSIIRLITGLGSIAKLTDIANGGSSLDAIKETAKEVSSKASQLKDDVTSVVGAVEDISETNILGSPITIGNLVQVAGAVTGIPSINAAATALDTVKNFNGNDSLVSKLAGPLNSIAPGIATVVKNVNEGVNNYNKLTSIADQVKNFVKNTDIKTGFGLVQDIAESLVRDATSKINSLASGSQFTDDELSSILQQAISGDPKQRAQALNTIVRNTSGFSKEMQDIIKSVGETQNANQFINLVKARADAGQITPEEIGAFEERVLFVENQLLELDTTISGSIVKSAIDFFSDDVDLKELAERYAGALSEFSAFTYIDSKEELGAEIRKVNRDISEVVVHASETYTNANIGAEEIHVHNNEQGFDGIQYHFVIRRDGRLQRGMPLEKVGSASNVNGHDKRCIDVLLIGGINAPSGTDNPEDYRSAQSFTRIQMETLEAVLEAFYRRYPGGQVMGHNDLSAEIEDPYFDVTEYAKTLFRKYSVYKDLLEDTAYEPADLIQQRIQ